jgi:tRNA threonylcarbamoyladenosine biosynthesis protein TsaB
MVAEPIILSIETATLAGSVALSHGPNILASLRGDNDTSHSNTLLSDIDSILNRAGRTLTEVDLFAVAAGPGSFTGLRIGIATVKGLAFTLRRACVAIPTLEAVAHSANPCERVVAILPAGRGEVFVQLFDVTNDTLTALDSPSHISPSQMLEKYSSIANVCWTGDAAQLHRDRIKEAAERNHRLFIEATASLNTREGWILIPQNPKLAENVATLALRKSRQNEIQKPEDIAAIYVRPSDAELNTRSIG